MIVVCLGTGMVPKFTIVLDGMQGGTAPADCATCLIASNADNRTSSSGLKLLYFHRAFFVRDTSIKWASFFFAGSTM